MLLQDQMKLYWNFFLQRISYSLRMMIFIKVVKDLLYGLVHFTTRVRDTRDTNAVRPTRLWREWKILILITACVETYFHIPTLTIWQMKVQEEKQFHSKNYLLQIPSSHAKMRKYTTKTELCTSKSYTLYCSCKCPCTFQHSCA